MKLSILRGAAMLSGGDWRGRAAAVLLLAVALAGCDRPSKLEEGVSTEVQVRKEFGDPVTITVEPDGTRSFDYPRQPEGWTNYVIRIGPDGKMSSLRQLLTEDNFARIQPGMTQQQVRQQLGRPAKMQHFDLKNEEVWDWRYRPQQESRLFSVTFGADGRVLRSASADDPRDSQGTR
jgi:outer membrane protein assembly factor BamE (lipoprotein component of BamABCDE complex)